jgi:type VI secretion system protein ImpG
VSAIPALGSDSLWKLTSLLTLNHLSLGHPDHLKALLRLFVTEGRRDRTTRRINERRIEGIRNLMTTPTDRLIGGAMIRGLDIRLTVSLSHFAGLGDVYLFGTLLDRFFGMYAPINTFTRLTVNDIDTGETWTWQERMGDQPLI